MKSIDDQIKCVAREIAMRKNVYPRQVANNRMKQPAADHELAAMESVIESLKIFKVISETAKFNCTIDGCPNPAIAVWYMPEGCYCKHDTYQGLCPQHQETAGGGPMTKLLDLPGWRPE